LGAIVVGGAADLVLLDARFSVVRTFVAGRLAYDREAAPT
jgi:hypothetical protein